MKNGCGASAAEPGSLPVPAGARRLEIFSLFSSRSASDAVWRRAVVEGGTTPSAPQCGSTDVPTGATSMKNDHLLFAFVNEPIRVSGSLVFRSAQHKGGGFTGPTKLNYQSFFLKCPESKIWLCVGFFCFIVSSRHSHSLGFPTLQTVLLCISAL